jgi:hypothetical protein
VLRVLVPVAFAVGVFIIGNITSIALVKTAARAEHRVHDVVDRSAHGQYAQRAVSH